MVKDLGKNNQEQMIDDANVDELENAIKNNGKKNSEKRADDYLKLQKISGKKQQEVLYSGKVLKKNEIQIFDLHQADEDFRKCMKLDKINEIAGVYEVVGREKKVQKILSITKNNFYNAFFEPIWKNLTNSERIKSLEWMFEYINQTNKLGLKNLTYFVTDDNLSGEDYKNDVNSLNGYFDPEQNNIFLNLNGLSNEGNLYLIVETLAHELTHAKQCKFSETVDLSKKNSFYEVSQTVLGNFDSDTIDTEFKIDYATMYALYRVCQSEKAAELQGLKTLKYYIELNEKVFGKNKNITHKYDKLKREILFSGTKKYKTKSGEEHFYPTSGILTNEKVILKGQSENLLKLIMLKNLYQYELEALYDAKKDIEIDMDDIRKNLYNNKITRDERLEKLSTLKKELELKEKDIKENKENISYIKEVFMETLENGELPENFDTKMFDVLNILEEPKSEYSLPKWLRKDEIKYKKRQELARKNFCLGKDKKEEKNECDQTNISDKNDKEQILSKTKKF